MQFLSNRQPPTKDRGNRQKDALFRHNLYSLQSTKYGYKNHLREGLLLLRLCTLPIVSLPVVGLSDGPQLSKECVSPTLSIQGSIRFTFIQGMRFSYTEYAVVGLPIVSLWDGLQSSKGCIPLVLDMQLSVQSTIIQGMRFLCTQYAIVMSQLLAYWTVCNHPMDAFLLH